METPERVPVAIFVANPPYRHPTLGFAPEEHGYGKDVDGEDAPRPNLKFGLDGRHQCFDIGEAVRLRAHTGNVQNGGNVFFEIPAEALRHGRALQNVIPASLPESGLSGSDKELLKALVKFGKFLPPKATHSAVGKMKMAVERFRVAGYDVPDGDKKIPIIRGRILELLDLLTTHGIIEATEDEGK